MVEGKQVTSGVGAVAAYPEEAARIGAKVLEAGGNAMDAAAAAGLACCMLAPQKNGVGGYVLAAVVLEGKTGKVWSLDANATAPAAAGEDIYEILPAGPRRGVNENEYNCSVVDNANVYGPLAVAVPGQLAGMGTLSERWGRLKWDQIVAPSQALLADGFAYGGELAGDIAAMEPVWRKYEPTAAHLMPEGRLPRADDIWHRPDMEGTLARLAAVGWRDFYDGQLGRQIADFVGDSGGILTRADMAGYAPRLTAPYGVTYRGAPVWGPVLANGSLSSLQALHMLDCLPPGAPGDPQYWHRLAEVLKRVWRDRLLYLGDPDFVDVPVQRLLSPEYAAGRVEDIRQFPDEVDGRGWGLSSRSLDETLHVSTADAEGNVVAATLTQGGNFGSCLTVPGTGIILGHGMCRLDPRPGGPNAVAGGKRPLNNVAPMIACLPGRDVATGLPGGRRIVSVGTQLVQRIVDWDATALQAAIGARLHVGIQEPLELLDTLSVDVVEALRLQGHAVEVAKRIGGYAHNAEFLRDQKRVRAGGNGWAAGV